MELGDRECEQWHAMQRRAPHLGNPFLAAAFAQCVGRVHDNARVAVLSRGPDVVGFFPFERNRFGIDRPIGAGLTDCQGLVHVPGLERGLDAKELMRACGLSVFEFDHLVEGQAPVEPYTSTRAASPVIDSGHGYGTFKAQLRERSPKVLRTTRSKGRKLGRDVGELRFEDDVRDPDALRLLMSWKSAQYRRTGRTDRFARPWIVGLVEHLLGAEDAACAGRLSMHYADGQPVAGHFGLRSEAVLAAWFPAYDVRFARVLAGADPAPRHGRGRGRDRHPGHRPGPGRPRVQGRTEEPGAHRGGGTGAARRASGVGLLSRARPSPHRPQRRRHPPPAVPNGRPCDETVRARQSRLDAARGLTSASVA